MMTSSLIWLHARRRPALQSLVFVSRCFTPQFTLSLPHRKSHFNSKQLSSLIDNQPYRNRWTCWPPAVVYDWSSSKRLRSSTSVEVKESDIPSSVHRRPVNNTDIKTTSSGSVLHDVETKNGPATGMVTNHIATALLPYYYLLRLDKPIGFWLLLWPCVWSIGLAASPGCLPDLKMLAVFGTGAVVMRGAGCVINDMWDRDIDSKVERTKARPIASGTIPPMDAFVFLMGLLAVGDIVLLQLNLFCVYLGASSLVLVATYPLMKRIMNWPQLYLGLVFNWGAYLGWAAIYGSCDYSVCVPLYLACISWTMIYDTIYAHQDKKDDVLQGVKSTALHLGHQTKHYLLGFTGVLLASSTMAGIFSHQTVPYYLGIGLATSHLLHQIITVNIDDPRDCGRKFASNYLVGFLMMAGIVASTLMKKKREDSTTEATGCQ